jgi:hypothetical protein
MHGTQKNMNTVNTARIYINFKYYTTDINVDINELFSAATKGSGTFRQPPTGARRLTS